MCGSAKIGTKKNNIYLLWEDKHYFKTTGFDIRTVAHKAGKGKFDLLILRLRLLRYNLKLFFPLELGSERAHFSLPLTILEMFPFILVKNVIKT